MNRDQQVLNIAQQLVQLQTQTTPYDCSGLREAATRLIELLRTALYPQVFGENRAEAVNVTVSCSLLQAAELLERIVRMVQPERAEPEAVVYQMVTALPQIRELLETDIQAAYDGDPAAKNTAEIMLAYPAFEAISIYRLAHPLYRLGVPMLPRMMTEYAHRLTGIDIHPGADIGSHFFIDHGTGVVIGETTTIGDHVKLYQGVTLGAKSFELDENGNPVKGIKRHPDIGSRVVIYSGATILGGGTSIGDGCVIGGNVWLTHSVEPGRTVLAAEERAQCRII